MSKVSKEDRGGTTYLNAPPSFKRPDGRWEHHVRQSDIERVRQCPELHRRSLYGLVEDRDNDSAVVGTCLHLAYAYMLGDVLGGGEPNISDACEIALTKLTELWPTCNNVQIANLSIAQQQIANCLRTFYVELLPVAMKGEPIAVERQFDIKVYEDEERDLYIAGTSDLWLESETWDFKHSTTSYLGSNAWKKQRYHPQPTVYQWARDMIENGENVLAYPPDAEMLPFSFVVINREKYTSEVLKIERNVGHCRAILMECLAIATMIEAELKTWPLSPDDWHCSPDWCPAWSDCMGKHLGGDPWGSMERRRINLIKMNRQKV